MRLPKIGEAWEFRLGIASIAENTYFLCIMVNIKLKNQKCGRPWNEVPKH